jgi:TRAP transporter TAXI family solute receptor
MSVSDDLGSRKRKNVSFLILAAGLFAFGAAAGGLYLALQPTTLRIAVGPQGSDDQKVVQALTQAFAADGGSVRLSMVPTDGPADSVNVLAAGKADLAVARGDMEMPSDARSVAILRKNVVVLWSSAGLPRSSARKNKIKTIADLAGHRIGVVGRTQINVDLLRIILTDSGVAPDKVAVTQFGVNQIAQMVRDPVIDAFMTVAPIDSKITVDAIAMTAQTRGEPRFLPIDVSEAIAHRHPLYESEEIPGSVFSSSPARPDDKIETVGVSHLIVARSSLSETTAGALVRELFTVRPLLARELPTALKIEKPDTDKDAALPAHPGAAAYIDGTERTFLEKYSDYMWISILVLSMLGSGSAWLRFHLKREEREENTLHRDKLLEAISKVRQVDSLEELDAMLAEADVILRETLDCYDDGAIEEGGLAAFGLVMEQFHHAVVDRRAVIGSALPDLQRLRRAETGRS